MIPKQDEIMVLAGLNTLIGREDNINSLINSYHEKTNNKGMVPM